jgi:glutamate synthase (NADPH/NADH) large chain
VVFTDGTVVGGVLDRNGLRPGRFWVTEDGLVVLASEAGVLDIPQDKIVQKGRLQPGRMFLVDLGQHRIISDEEIKAQLAAAAPYGEWLIGGRILLSDLPERDHVVPYACFGHPAPAGLRLHRGGVAADLGAEWPPPASSRLVPWAPTHR